MFSNALNAVLTLLLIGVVGFLMHRAGWIDDRVEDFLTKAVLKVFVPISLFNNALKYVTADFFRSASLAVPRALQDLFAHPRALSQDPRVGARQRPRDKRHPRGDL